MQLLKDAIVGPPLDENEIIRAEGNANGFLNMRRMETSAGGGGGGEAERGRHLRGTGRA